MTETNGKISESTFRWIVGGLSVVLWAMLMLYINDLKVEMRSLQLSQESQNVVIDSNRSDIKINTARLNELTEQVGQLQGITQKRR